MLILVESVHMFPRLRHTCFENHIIMKNKKSDRVKICAALNAAEYRKMKAKRQVKLSDEEEDEDLCPVDCVKEFRSNAELNAILEGAKKTDSLVVVDFYRTACGSCKYIEQGFTKLCKGAGDKEASVVFLKHNVMDEYEEQSEVAEHLKIKASIFHFGSISLIAEPSRSAHLAAMKIAKQSGAMLSYDPNLRLPLWPSADEARKGILSVWDKADFIKVSDNEVGFLTGEDPEKDEVAMSLWHPRLKLLLVTHGQNGCRYYTKVGLGTNSREKVGGGEGSGVESGAATGDARKEVRTGVEACVGGGGMGREPRVSGEAYTGDGETEGEPHAGGEPRTGGEAYMGIAGNAGGDPCAGLGATGVVVQPGSGATIAAMLIGAMGLLDTTGAGDAFVGGILSQIINDMSVLKDEEKLREALRFANGCGAITTTEKGAIPALPDKAAVMQLLLNKLPA